MKVISIVEELQMGWSSGSRNENGNPPNSNRLPANENDPSMTFANDFICPQIHELVSLPAHFHSRPPSIFLPSSLWKNSPQFSSRAPVFRVRSATQRWRRCWESAVTSEIFPAHSELHSSKICVDGFGLSGNIAPERLLAGKLLVWVTFIRCCRLVTTKRDCLRWIAGNKLSSGQTELMSSAGRR